MIKVIVYIDGFNLYHAIDNLKIPAFKWLNLKSLSSSLLRENEELTAVKYFSAYATWKPEGYARHRDYVKALRHFGVETIMGKFKEQQSECRSCGASWKKHEEKETDVHIAISMVADGLQNLFDRAILISADTDIVPAVKMLRSLTPEKEIFVASPPGRLGCARALNPKLEINKGRIAKHRLPEEIFGHSGALIVSCPERYRLI